MSPSQSPPSVWITIKTKPLAYAPDIVYPSNFDYAFRIDHEEPVCF